MQFVLTLFFMVASNMYNVYCGYVIYAPEAGTLVTDCARQGRQNMAGELDNEQKTVADHCLH